MRFYALLAALSLLVSLQSLRAEAFTCTTRYDKDLTEARDLRKKGNLDGAEQKAQKIFDADHSALRAQYTLGLIKIDRSVEAQGAAKTDLYNKGMADLLTVAKAIDNAFPTMSDADRTCVKSEGLFTIMVTVGFNYLQDGSYNVAAGYFAKAKVYDDRQLLTPAEHGKLLTDLGSLAYNIGDYPKARVYLTNAVKAGDSKAAVILRGLPQNG